MQVLRDVKLFFVNPKTTAGLRRAKSGTGGASWVVLLPDYRGMVGTGGFEKLDHETLRVRSDESGSIWCRE